MLQTVGDNPLLEAMKIQREHPDTMFAFQKIADKEGWDLDTAHKVVALWIHPLWFIFEKVYGMAMRDDPKWLAHKDECFKRGLDLMIAEREACANGSK